MGKVEISPDQVYRGNFGNMWGVIEAHPRRRGFWTVTNANFPYDIAVMGRRELEAMELLPDPASYYRGRDGVHPGISYWRSFQKIAISYGLTEDKAIPPYEDKRNPFAIKLERLRVQRGISKLRKSTQPIHQQSNNIV